MEDQSNILSGSATQANKSSSYTPKQIEALRRMYAARPDQWLKYATGENIWWRQREIMRSVAINSRTAVGSCNSSGKSFIGARLVPWFLSTYYPATVITTAPETRTVEEIIWREINTTYQLAKNRGIILGNEAPLATKWNYTGQQNKTGYQSYAIGFTPREYTANAFQGFHNRNMLVIIDEASEVSDDVFRGINSVVRGANYRILAISQETRISGWFYETNKLSNWHHIRISAFDSPNVREGREVHPGIITAKDVVEAREQYGEESWEWRVYILGLPPDMEENALIALDWCHAAVKRKPDYEMINRFETEVGADIARFGSDSSVYVAQKGFNFFSGIEHKKLDTTQNASNLLDFCDSVKAKKVRIDAIGVGAGVLDLVREKAPPHIEVIEMQGSERAQNPMKYVNAVTEWWDHLAGLLKTGLASGPLFEHKKVVGDLVSRKAKMLSNRLMQLESKEDLKKRIKRSPDWGDAAVMASATGIMGTAKKAIKTSWGEGN